MSIFISYSSLDSVFVDKLAVDLVKKRIVVWLDKWAMQPGDSLLDKIQSGLTDSSFLLVVLSNNSVRSEWCKKEINSALMRELEEKKVIIIPVLLEQCTIPIFLKEKLYADFTKEYEIGFEALIRPLATLYSANMGRVEDTDRVTDFAVNWGLDKINHQFILEIDIVTWYPQGKKTVLFQIKITGNDKATERFKTQHLSGLSHLMKDTLLQELLTNEVTKDLHVLITNDKVDPHIIKIQDNKLELEFDVVIRGVLMGVDNGNDILIHLQEFIQMIISIYKS